MGWAVYYREFEIYPDLVPVREEDVGIIGFRPIAHVFKRGTHDSLFLEVRADSDAMFTDAAQANQHILSRVKKMIDGDETTLSRTG